ncbi:MAG: lysophospholipid acyltransferase family protein [Angustibacter sp.]
MSHGVHLGAASGRRIGKLLFSSVYRSTTLDAWRVPTSGPVLFASNHTSFLDGPLVFGLAPRPVHFLVKTEMFHGLTGWFLDRFGQIPVDRSGVDRSALHSALEVLQTGGAVGVFPEGSRGLGDVATVHEGITWLAMRSGAPVVPVACLGTRVAGDEVGRPPRPLHRVAVAFGDPVTLQAPAGIPRRVASRELTEQLRGTLAAHVRDSSRRLGIALHSTLPQQGGPTLPHQDHHHRPGLEDAS